MRTLSPDIWDDEWFGQLDPIGMIIWVGLLTRVADDQGRLLDNPNLIKSRIFPLAENPSAYDVSNTLAFFMADGKLISYQADGKHYLQFANWWKYQASSQWMGASKYPAPEGWQDCYNYHGKGNALVTSPNWKDRAGGYSKIEDKIAPKIASEIVYDVKDDVNDNDNKKKGAAAFQFSQNASHAEAERALLSASGLPALPAGALSFLDTVSGLLTQYPPDAVKGALSKAKIKWCQTKRKDGGGTYSVLNFAWVDWAIADLSGQEVAAPQKSAVISENPPPAPDKSVPIPPELKAKMANLFQGKPL